MTDEQDYKGLIGEIVKKQIAILGPDVALLKASNIEGLRLDAKGNALTVEGDQHEILQKLVDEYIELSGQIVKNVLKPVFAKYPSIEIDIK